MTSGTGPGRTDTASRDIDASPEQVFAAFSSAEAIMEWLPPEGMTGRVLEYDFRQGGRFRIELCYTGKDPHGPGKTTGNSDVSAGEFVELIPARRIRQTVEFESDDQAFQQPMTMTWNFEPVGQGTCVTVTASDVPDAISEEDHAKGLNGSLANLAGVLR